MSSGLHRSQSSADSIELRILTSEQRSSSGSSTGCSSYLQSACPERLLSITYPPGSQYYPQSGRQATVTGMSLPRGFKSGFPSGSTAAAFPSGRHTCRQAPSAPSALSLIPSGLFTAAPVSYPGRFRMPSTMEGLFGPMIPARTSSSYFLICLPSCHGWGGMRLAIPPRPAPGRQI